MRRPLHAAQTPSPLSGRKCAAVASVPDARDQARRRSGPSPLSVTSVDERAGAAAVVALDGVDGWIARRIGRTTVFGARFDMEVDAALMLVDRKTTTTEELLEVMPGPDFPTGGVIVEPKESILDAYETGRGRFRMQIGRASCREKN